MLFGTPIESQILVTLGPHLKALATPNPKTAKKYIHITKVKHDPTLETYSVRFWGSRRN